MRGSTKAATATTKTRSGVTRARRPRRPGATSAEAEYAPAGIDRIAELVQEAEPDDAVERRPDGAMHDGLDVPGAVSTHVDAGELDDGCLHHAVGGVQLDLLA